jgi:predicted DsbA family dithiol-disulfide isomerase
LERTLRERSDLEAKVRWRPFRLQPEMLKVGLPWSEFARQKFGGETNAKAAFAHVAAAGEPERGRPLRLRPSGERPEQRRGAPTHPLCGATRPAVGDYGDALFRACFTEGGNLNDREQLVDLASSVGLDVGKVRGCLEDGDAGDEILAGQEAAGRLDIVACPSTSSTAAGHSQVPRRRRRSGA